MYCAIDEAGSHVGSNSFRLVVGVYDHTGRDLLGSACSQSVRVMANNNIPEGGAHIRLVVNIRCCYLERHGIKPIFGKSSFAMADGIAGSIGWACCPLGYLCVCSVCTGQKVLYQCLQLTSMPDLQGTCNVLYQHLCTIGAHKSSR